MLRTRPVFEGRARERMGGAMREFLEFRALEKRNRSKTTKIGMKSECGEVDKTENQKRMINLPENASLTGKSEIESV